MNVYNDEPIASLCKCPYELSLDFRYQIYGIRIFFSQTTGRLRLSSNSCDIVTGSISFDLSIIIL